MRGLALVLTVAFVFASSALLVGPALAQSSTPTSSPPYPEDYRQEPTDAVIQGRVLDGSGTAVPGASVSAYNYGGPVYAAEGDAATSSGSGTASSEPARYPYYGGNSTTTAADGSFRLGVYSGDNQISVYKDGYAGRSLSVPVAAGQTVTQDVTVEKFPEKTARIEGRITDLRTGNGLSFASVSVNSPWYGVYECSIQEGQEGGGSEPKPMPAEDASTSIVAPDYFRGCSITVHPDGRFDGMVTPGYSIVSVYAYSDCAVTQDADGSSSSECGPQYFGWSRTLTLAANDTTVVNAALRSPPAPDAVVSGYLIDAETGQAIPGAQISFSNQETYGYGYATTDGDGSYKLRLRSGYHMVSVYAQGHLPWEGTLAVAKGNSDFDVELTLGEASYGGCCILYADGSKSASGEATAVMPPSAAGMDDSADVDQEGGQQAVYQDLGGGLGPYDASERDAELEDGSNGAPGFGLVAVLAAVVAALALMARRRA